MLSMLSIENDFRRSDRHSSCVKAIPTAAFRHDGVRYAKAVPNRIGHCCREAEPAVVPLRLL